MKIYKDKNLKLFLMVFLFFSNICLAEMWPTLENYVNDCVLIVKAQTNITKEGELVFRVLENWKGQYKPNDFLRTTKDGYFYAFQGEHGVDVTNGQEIIFFFTKHNQPIENKISSHSTAFPIRDGKIIYAATNKNLRKEYTVEEFKKRILETNNETKIFPTAKTPKMIERDENSGERIIEPEWSPNDKTIVFTRNPSRTTDDHHVIFDKDEIWTVSEDGNNVKRLAEGRKLFWSDNDTLIYTYAAEKKGKTESRYGSINIKTGQSKNLKEKPFFPEISFKFNNDIYSILNTKNINELRLDKERIRFFKQFNEHNTEYGFEIKTIDIHETIMLTTQLYHTDNYGYEEYIIYLNSNIPTESEKIVSNAYQPALSHDGLKLLFLRDGFLWIKRFEKPFEPNVSKLDN